MNLLLINPAAPHTARLASEIDFNIGDIGLFPPIGLISLAAYLRAKSAHQVSVHDQIAHKTTNEQIVALVGETKARVVGLTVFTYTVYDAYRLIQDVKAAHPQVTIVVGGPHTSLFARESLENPAIDYLVVGEGEEALLHLLDRLEAGLAPEAVDGLAFRTQEGVHVGRPGAVADLDSLPLPAYDLLDETKYYSTFGRGGKTITLNSSRGCPYQCTFCQVLVKKYRAHSLDYMIGYVKHFYAQGYTSFYFFDDLFNITKQRVMDFSQRILDEGLAISWIFRGRVDQLDDEACWLAAKAGCVQALLGVEDYTDANLREIRKAITMDLARQAVAACCKNNIMTSTNWIVGLPTHKTPRHLDELAEEAVRLGGDYAMFSILQVLPGCAIYEQGVREGAIDPNAWAAFAKSPTPDFDIPFYAKYLTPNEQAEGCKRCYQRFYRRPSYILKRLARIRSLEELWHHVKAGLKVLSQ